MFENIGHFFKRMVKTEQQKELGSKDAAKERLHLVLMQDRANVSADFLELMKQEIIEVIKKYIVVDEEAIDVRLTNLENEDGTNGAPSLFANIPIVNIKNDMMAEKIKEFKGVDFNKEMGLPVKENKDENNEKEEEKEEKTKVIELSESYETKNIQEENLEENHNEDEEEEVKELFEEVDDDDDDDDVTFDDLLKAAEAADREKEKEESKENASNTSKNHNSKNNNQKSKDKRKKKN